MAITPTTEPHMPSKSAASNLENVNLAT